jgi:aarF domain-containing kinase
MNNHGINARDLSTLLGTMYLEMIFGHGFVHCDPHQGNVLVRRIPTRIWPFGLFQRNFEVILLDHGLYRQLQPDFLLDYSKLWISIIHGDESRIEKASERLFRNAAVPPRDGIIPHRLFASMISGRSWSAISTSIKSLRSPTEVLEAQKKATSANFMRNVSLILSSIPREMLLLMKTNDILRAVDSSLGVGDGYAKYSIVRLGAYCSKYIFKIESAETSGVLSRRYWRLWWNYVKSWTWFKVLGVLIMANPA